MAKIRKRVSFNLKPETINLIHETSKIFNEDMSKIVDDAIQFRLKYINKEKTKLQKEEEKKMNPKEWVDNYWNNYQEDPTKEAQKEFSKYWKDKTHEEIEKDWKQKNEMH